MISKESLLEIGRQKGLSNKEHIEKNYFQDLILSYLYKKTNKLIFKGGTALYKLYNLSRFSEDLDFSVIEPIDVEKLIKETINDKELFKIKSIKTSYNTVLVKLSCKGLITKQNFLKIDINLKNSVLKGFDIKSYISDYADINPFFLRSLKPEEIISEKIHALLSREKPRDLYDLFFLLRLSKFDRNLIDQKLNIFNMKYDKKIIDERVNNLEFSWEKELKPFVFGELPDFNVVKDFVLKNLK